MNIGAAKNQALLKQYPFLKDILFQRMEPYGGENGRRIDDLVIRVEKADGNLMFRRADNVGLGDSSCIFQAKGNCKDQVMRRGEYAFAVNGDNKVINRLNFPRNREDQRQRLGEVYAWQVLWSSKTLNASKTGYMFGDCLWATTKYIVWVTVNAWHTDTNDNDAPDGRCGEFRDRSVQITIYGEPDQGFEQLHEESSVYTNLVLDTRVITRGIVTKDHDIISINGMLHEMCIQFQDEVYFNGMKEILDGGKRRGASGQFGAVKVLCAEMIDYNRVMLEDAGSYITFQLRPGSKHMYVLGQQGTLPQIRNLVRTVVRMWNQNPELRAAFKPDAEVYVV